MLIHFSVENYKCFAEEAFFSLIASSDSKHAYHLYPLKLDTKTSVLRAAAMYGANGHGKSKFVEAINFAQMLIIHGTKRGGKINVESFLLDEVLSNSPSRFEFRFLQDDVEYTYGFVISKDRVHEEWLFSRPNVREVLLFERVTDEKGVTKFEFGSSLAKKNSKNRQVLSFLGEGTRKNQLFLKEAAERNVSKLEPAFDWFGAVLSVITADSLIQPLEMKANKEKEFISFMSDFLKSAGTGIEEIKTVEEVLDFEKQFPGMPENLKADILESINDGKIITLSFHGESYSICKNESDEGLLISLKTVHKRKNDSDVLFDFSQESAGTQRLMQILPVLADMKSQKRVYVIDELDRKLHPLLSRMFVKCYLETEHANTFGQMIFTTHDTHLLDLDLLRRDEIWFVEKNSYGAAQMYSLSDLKIRADLNIEKGYLNGRFGGIPFIGDVERLGWVAS